MAGDEDDWVVIAPTLLGRLQAVLVALTPDDLSETARRALVGLVDDEKHRLVREMGGHGG